MAYNIQILFVQPKPELQNTLQTDKVLPTVYLALWDGNINFDEIK